MTRSCVSSSDKIWPLPLYTAVLPAHTRLLLHRIAWAGILEGTRCLDWQALKLLGEAPPPSRGWQASVWHYPFEAPTRRKAASVLNRPFRTHQLVLEACWAAIGLRQISCLKASGSQQSHHQPQAAYSLPAYTVVSAMWALAQLQKVIGRGVAREGIVWQGIRHSAQPHFLAAAHL